MFIILLSLFSLAESMQFEIFRGSRNEPLVDIRVIANSIPSGRLIRVKLTLRGDAVSSFESGDRFQVAFGQSTYPFVTGAFTFSDTPSQLALGIGSTTRLVREARSLTLIGNRLFIGTSHRRFTYNCHPNSTISVPVYGEGGPLYATAAIMIGTTTIVYHSISISSEDILSIPSYVGRRWIGILESHGAIQTGSETMSNCTTTTVSFLPTITIRFPSIGQIVLEPSDFVDIENASCRFLFQYQHGVEDITDWSFAPLLIPHVNFRIQQDRILICDARD
jgi:hypothetical protein